MPVSTIRLICDWCKTPFDKLLAEHSRRIKKGTTRFFCTQSCQTRRKNQTHPCTTGANLRPGNRRDSLTGFRWYIARAVYRKSKGTTDLTAAYLQALWESQGGICPFSGQLMRLTHNTRGFAKKDPGNASLDRIDGSRGYVQGNVRFVSLMANYARNDFTDEQLLEFCSRVVAHASRHRHPVRSEECQKARPAGK